jgi:WhiB family transcriptional regulator, redox-sensing transcriptional regulator
MFIRHQPSAPVGESLWPSGQAPAAGWLGLVSPAWFADAACREHPELCWVDPGNSGSQVSAAKDVCARCLVRAECLASAMADPTLVGIWGATTTRERKLIHRGSGGNPPRSEEPITVPDGRAGRGVLIGPRTTVHPPLCVNLE